jgi:hypothetical protein
MIAGDSLRRNYSIPGADFKLADPEKSFWAQLGQTTQVDLAQRAIGFNCMNYGKSPEGAMYRHYLPEKDYLDANCPQGIRLEIMFPSCWNGKDVDSPNHKSHVAYPDLVTTGNCPSGFDIRLPGLFYETIWDTGVFKDKQGKFVLSNGDVQGERCPAVYALLTEDSLANISCRLRLPCRLHHGLAGGLPSASCGYLYQ